MKTIHYITEEDRIPCLFDFCPPGCQAGSHISDLQGIISAYDDFMRLKPSWINRTTSTAKIEKSTN